MEQEEFDQNFQTLNPGQKRVLEKFLAGETDAEIAKSLRIKENTIRKYIEQICNLFGIESKSEGKRVSRRTNLVTIIAKYKPELVGSQISAEIIKPEKTTYQNIPDPNFVGRDRAIKDLDHLVSLGTKLILIQAQGGVGKTTLARKYLQQKFGSFLEFPIAKETQNITSVESLLEERLRQLNEEPGREFGVSLDRLKRKLQIERMGILIDNLEPALDEDGKFIQPHRRYVELLLVLADPSVQSVTLITSRHHLHECDVTFAHYPLEGLSEEAWQQFLKSRQIQTNVTALTAIHNAYGGNAKAMEILTSDIKTYFSGDLEKYWRANQQDLLNHRSLENLVVSQFNRLQQSNPIAFKLLCRLGCYRYQDVPSVPVEGLFCLLWDVPEGQRLRVFNKLLRDYSLVEFKDGEYWLHPVIRAEAIARLRASEDWEIANHKAAEFWTESVKTVETTEDAQRAFEAYYHYYNIDEFNLAAEVILLPRKNKWYKLEDGEYLGNSFDRFGFSTFLELEINRIIKNIDRQSTLAFIHYVLGVQYYLIGSINKAIKNHKISIIKIEQSLKNNDIEDYLKRRLRRDRTSAIIYLCLCKINLCAFKEALELLENAISICKENKFDFHVIAFEPTLAFLYSCSECLDIEKSKAFADRSYNQISYIMDKITSRGKAYMLFFLGATYKNLGNIEITHDIYQKTISYCDESQYTQFKGKSLCGLAELYRIQGEFETALAHHSEAIELLDKIGAKCDLAETYYQLGLTYQKMGETEKSQTKFDLAIQLFTEMEAPKQVEKVQNAILTGIISCPLQHFS